jgi:hypothetical protein
MPAHRLLLILVLLARLGFHFRSRRERCGVFVQRHGCGGCCLSLCCNESQNEVYSNSIQFNLQFAEDEIVPVVVLSVAWVSIDPEKHKPLSAMKVHTLLVITQLLLRSIA